MSVDVSEYRLLYIKTASELIQRYADILHSVRKTGLALDTSTIDELHRIFHSLKGQSLALGYQKLGNLFFQLEQLFSYGKEKEHIIPYTITSQLPPSDRLLTFVRQPEDTTLHVEVDVQLAEVATIERSLGIIQRSL